MTNVETLVIGAGQAGLALSRLLADAGRDHVVLERGGVGERWRSERWDSLALLTPNWANRLPLDEAPAHPDAYMSRAEFAATLDRYARSFGAPLRERTTVTAVERTTGGFRVATHRGEWRDAGFEAASGSTGIYADSATSYPAFLAAWAIGAKFSDAVAAANNADPLRASDNAARVWFNSQGKPEKANQVNSHRVISGNGDLKIGTM